jgi:hypothetical protein
MRAFKDLRQKLYPPGWTTFNTRTILNIIIGLTA